MAASFAALVPLRDYPSGSVPCKEPYRAAVTQGRRQGKRGGRGKGDGQGSGGTDIFYLHPLKCCRNPSGNVILYTDINSFSIEIQGRI
ncbi:hypothetical protein BEI60_24945 [Eisenbergiella tayi]|nr:hypothetical protein BEI60_24945 [Eisenbergiella tayi]